MTSPESRDDRGAVRDRDGSACLHCGADGDALRTYPVGDGPADGCHESALATVCADCADRLRGRADGIETGGDLFEALRAATRTQGEAVSDAAAFASLATSLPGALAADDEPEPDYPGARRELLVAIAVVDADLRRLEAVDAAALGPDVAAAFEAFSSTAERLQAQLRDLVALAETAADGLGRCHACFEPLDGGATRCPACDAARPDADAWLAEDGTIAFDRLFAAVNDALRESTETTEDLTARTTALAEALVGD
ncbi:HNH endonuclease [Salinilacihabitans rarus]|uniref:HNH endonuclease n=1 Tax=Salinilacihabitans rarus TaxID=2961596 RepID=UPI0020C8C9A4|nr:HNH endonuclease [Salinilacihabitans rarus]